MRRYTSLITPALSTDDLLEAQASTDDEREVAGESAMQSEATGSEILGRDRSKDVFVLLLWLTKVID